MQRSPQRCQATRFALWRDDLYSHRESMTGEDATSARAVQRKVVLPAPRGYRAGVQRAVEIVRESHARFGPDPDRM